MNTTQTASQSDFSVTLAPAENGSSDPEYQRNFSRVMLSGNGIMLIAMLGIITCIIIGYTHDEYFSLWTQVASHVALILLAAALKIGYVMRCIGLHGLGAIQL